MAGRKTTSNKRKNKDNGDKTKIKSYKTYKVYPLHHLIFYSCLSVSTRDKITDFLIKEFISEDIDDIPLLSKSELLDFMVMKVNEKDENELKSIQRKDERINELVNLLTLEGVKWDGTRIHLQTYASPITHETVLQLAKKTETIGEVVEKAIENYVNIASETHFQIIKLAFKNNLKVYEFEKYSSPYED